MKYKKIAGKVLGIILIIPVSSAVLALMVYSIVLGGWIAVGLYATVLSGIGGIFLLTE